MSDKIINEINQFQTFKFDKQNNRVINLKSKEDTNIDEYLEIEFLLDNNYIRRTYKQNFEIQIIK
jgi:hypothetical protein